MADIDHTKVHLEYLDARDETAQVIKYGVKSVPYFVMEEDDRIINTHAGTMSVTEYASWLGTADYEHDGQPDEAQEWHDFDPEC